jgi:hypothetical protein
MVSWYYDTILLKNDTTYISILTILTHEHLCHIPCSLSCQFQIFLDQICLALRWPLIGTAPTYTNFSTFMFFNGQFFFHASTRQIYSAQCALNLTEKHAKF